MARREQGGHRRRLSRLRRTCNKGEGSNPFVLFLISASRQFYRLTFDQVPPTLGWVDPPRVLRGVQKTEKRALTMIPFARAAVVLILCAHLAACSGSDASASGSAGPGAGEWQEVLERLVALEAARDGQDAIIAQLESELADANAGIAALEAALAGANTAIAALEVALEGTSVTEFDDRLAAVEETLTCASYDSVEHDFILEGCNVHVRNGSGFTEAVSGFGNLIVGYNASLGLVNRTGSHNLIIGDGHQYSSYGGLIAGFRNTVSSPGGSVTGGTENTVRGFWGSITGGRNNTIANSGDGASISGGAGRTLSMLNGWATSHVLLGNDALTIDAPAMLIDATTVRIRATTTAELSASGPTAINGAFIRLNGGSAPAARMGDPVTVTGGGPGTIAAGSSTVLIGN